LALPDEARRHCGVELVSMKDVHDVDAIVLAVAHRVYQDMGLTRIAALCRNGCPILIDIKAVFEPQQAHSLGIQYWRL
jgi:UDP-N-acetyl-D-galactosamine dehydrogenase